MSNMMKKVPGAPAPQSVMEMGNQARAAQAVGDKDIVYSTQNGQNTNNFPVIPFPQDSYDETMKIKSQFAGAAADNMGNWMVPFTEKEAEYVARKRNADEQAQYDQWVYQKYNLADPAQLFLFQQMCPSQFERREELIKYQVALANRYANIRLRGAKNEDDLKFEWLVETERIKLPGVIWDPTRARPNENADAKLRRYRRARFSVLDWLTVANRNMAWRANPNNLADPRGLPQQDYAHYGLELANYALPTTQLAEFGHSVAAGNQPRQ